MRKLLPSSLLPAALALLSLTPAPALADTTLPHPRPPWVPACVERFEAARREVGRRYPAFRAWRTAVLDGAERLIELVDGGDQPFTFAVWVRTTDRDDPPHSDGWEGDELSDAHGDDRRRLDLGFEGAERAPVDCPPDTPQFHRWRVAHGRRGDIEITGMDPPMQRTFFRAFRRAIDGCLATGG